MKSEQKVENMLIILKCRCCSRLWWWMGTFLVWWVVSSIAQIGARRWSDEGILNNFLFQRRRFLDLSWSCGRCQGWTWELTCVLQGKHFVNQMGLIEDDNPRGFLGFQTGCCNDFCGHWSSVKWYIFAGMEFHQLWARESNLALIVSVMLIYSDDINLCYSLPHDLGASTVGGGLPRGHHHPHLLRGGAPGQPQLLGEGRGHDTRQQPLPVHAGAGVACLQGQCHLLSYVLSSTISILV